MTIDTTTTAGKIAVMQAFERGEACQWQYKEGDGEKWFRVQVPSWAFGEIRYRIKPREPREVWIVVSAGVQNAWKTRAQAEQHAKSFPGEIVHLREVIE